MKKAARAFSTIGLVFNVIEFVLVFIFLGACVLGLFFPERLVIEDFEPLATVDAVTTFVGAYLIYAAIAAVSLLIAIIIVGAARGRMITTNYKKRGPFVAHIIAFFFGAAGIFFLLSGILGLINWSRERTRDQHI